MNKTRTVRAAPGRLVKDPETGLPVTNETTTVPDSTFWRRRIKAGDVVEEVKKAKQPKN